MKNCGCNGSVSPTLPVVGAVVPRPIIADQCDIDCQAVPAPLLPAISQVVFAKDGTSTGASFRWVTASTGHNVLEVRMGGKVGWIPVLTSKP